jgi:hypothetical protein
MSIAFVPNALDRLSSDTSSSLSDVVLVRWSLIRRGTEYSAIELALRRDGIAGVWGVCGEIGLPGDDDVDMDVAATIGGTLDSCRLDELDDRCRKFDEDIDSVSALLDSRIDWNFESWAVVLLVDASPEGSKLCRFFLLSNNFKKSEILSSSVCKEPELAPPSAIIPEPGWAEEDKLCLPLLPWSSSTNLLPVPNDDLARR